MRKLGFALILFFLLAISYSQESIKPTNTYLSVDYKVKDNNVQLNAIVYTVEVNSFYDDSEVSNGDLIKTGLVDKGKVIFYVKSYLTNDYIKVCEQEVDNGYASCSFNIQSVVHSENACVDVLVNYIGDDHYLNSRSESTVCPNTDVMSYMFNALASTLLANSAACFPAYLILALLFASMYASGRNPLGLFDISVPHINKLKKFKLKPAHAGLSKRFTKRNQAALKGMDFAIRKFLLAKGISSKEYKSLIEKAKDMAKRGDISFKLAFTSLLRDLLTKKGIKLSNSSILAIASVAAQRELASAVKTSGTAHLFKELDEKKGNLFQRGLKFAIKKPFEWADTYVIRHLAGIPFFGIIWEGKYKTFNKSMRTLWNFTKLNVGLATRLGIRTYEKVSGKKVLRDIRKKELRGEKLTMKERLLKLGGTGSNEFMIFNQKLLDVVGVLREEYKKLNEAALTNALSYMIFRVIEQKGIDIDLSIFNEIIVLSAKAQLGDDIASKQLREKLDALNKMFDKFNDKEIRPIFRKISEVVVKKGLSANSLIELKGYLSSKHIRFDSDLDKFLNLIRKVDGRKEDDAIKFIRLYDSIKQFDPIKDNSFASTGKNDFYLIFNKDSSKLSSDDMLKLAFTREYLNQIEHVSSYYSSLDRTKKNNLLGSIASSSFGIFVFKSLNEIMGIRNQELVKNQDILSSLVRKIFGDSFGKENAFEGFTYYLLSGAPREKERAVKEVFDKETVFSASLQHAGSKKFEVIDGILVERERKDFGFDLSHMWKAGSKESITATRTAISYILKSQHGVLNVDSEKAILAYAKSIFYRDHLPALMSMGSNNIYGIDYTKKVEKSILPMAKAMYGLFESTGGDLLELSSSLNNYRYDYTNQELLLGLSKNLDKFKEFLKQPVPADFDKKVGTILLHGGKIVPYTPHMLVTYTDVVSGGKFVIKTKDGWKEIDLHEPIKYYLKDLSKEESKSKSSKAAPLSSDKGSKHKAAPLLTEDVKKLYGIISSLRPGEKLNAKQIESLKQIKDKDERLYAYLVMKYRDSTNDFSLWDEFLKDHEVRMVVNKEQAEEAGIKLGTFTKSNVASTIADKIERYASYTAKHILKDESEWTAGSAVILSEGREFSRDILEAVHEQQQLIKDYKKRLKTDKSLTKEEKDSLKQEIRDMKEMQRLFGNALSRYLAWEYSWSYALTRDPRLRTPMMFRGVRDYQLSFFPSGPAMPYESEYAEIPFLSASTRFNSTLRGLPIDLSLAFVRKVFGVNEDKLEDIKYRLSAGTYRPLADMLYYHNPVKNTLVRFSHLATAVASPFILVSRAMSYRGYPTQYSTGDIIYGDEQGNVYVDRKYSKPFDFVDHDYMPGLFDFLAHPWQSFGSLGLLAKNLYMGVTGRPPSQDHLLPHISPLFKERASGGPGFFEGGYLKEKGLTGESVRFGGQRPIQINSVLFDPSVHVVWGGQANPGHTYYDSKGRFKLHEAMASWANDSFKGYGRSKNYYNSLSNSLVQNRSVGVETLATDRTHHVRHHNVLSGTWDFIRGDLYAFHPQSIFMHPFMPVVVTGALGVQRLKTLGSYVINGLSSVRNDFRTKPVNTIAKEYSLKLTKGLINRELSVFNPYKKYPRKFCPICGAPMYGNTCTNGHHISPVGD